MRQLYLTFLKWKKKPYTFKFEKDLKITAVDLYQNEGSSYILKK